jgi:2-polyprenyl-6-methoxyphenol hydroxylase-like FAD-dependent oxidoreductase
MQTHVDQGIAMALEDAFLLSRLLSGPSVALPEAFEKFDKIRRPRVEKFYKLAMGRGELRKKTGPWALWMKKTAFWALIWTFRTFGLNRWGFGESDLVHDIVEEQT